MYIEQADDSTYKNWAAELTNEQIDAALMVWSGDWITDEDRLIYRSCFRDALVAMFAAAPVAMATGGSDRNLRDTSTTFDAERVEEAFRDGFYAAITYNDVVINTADDAWEEAKAGLLKTT